VRERPLASRRPTAHTANYVSSVPMIFSSAGGS